MNRCVCNGLGAYIDCVDSHPDYVVVACDDHKLPPREEEDAAACRVDECLDAVAAIRDILWPDGNADAEWSSETIEDVARALNFLRPVQS